MAIEDGYLFASLRIPHPGTFVPGRRHDPPAIVAESRMPESARMAAQDGHLLTALCVPDARSVVTKRGRDRAAAVTAEARALHLGRMAIEHHELATGLCIPNGGNTTRARQHPPTVRAEYR